MAQRVFSSQKMLDQQNQAQNSSGNFAKAEFVNLKPDPATGETVKHLRIIGFPIRYRQFTDKQPDKARRDAGDKTATKKVPFPDAHLNSNFTRIGTEGDPAYGECPWTRLGYIGSWRFAVNVLERQKDGTSVVKILEKGSSIFKNFMEWETNNRESNIDNPDDDPLCVMLGGAVAHDVKIKARANPNNKFGGVDYVISVAPRKSQITEEEIELLRSVGQPKDDELAAERARYEADRKDDPQLPEWQDWYLYGYNLSAIFKPTPIKTEGVPATPVAEATDILELSVEDVATPVDTPKPANAPRSSRTKTTASAPAAPADAELANPFEDETPGDLLVVDSDDEESDW